MEYSETQNNDNLMEVGVTTEQNADRVLENTNLNIQSDVLTDSLLQPGNLVEINKATGTSEWKDVGRTVELINNENSEDLIKSHKDTSSANIIPGIETQILSDDSVKDESDDDLTSDSSDEDSSCESSKIDFANDISDDEDIEQTKPGSKIGSPEIKHKTSDLEVPHVDFSLLKLRDLSSIDIPKDTAFKLAGTFMHIMEYDRSVMVESAEGVPTLNLGSILFRKDGEILGEICDIIGNVKKPCYSLNFKTMKEIQDKKLERGESIFYAPLNSNLTYLVRQEDVIIYGTDASGAGDKEASEEDFSDDEKEAKCKKGTRGKNAGTAWPAERKKVKVNRRLNTLGARGCQPQQNFQSQQNFQPIRNQTPSSISVFSAPPPIAPVYPPQPSIPPPMYTAGPGFSHVLQPYPPVPPSCPVPPPMNLYYGPSAPPPSYPYIAPQAIPNWPPHQASPLPQQWPPANVQQWPPHPNPYHPHQGGQNPGAYYR